MNKNLLVLLALALSTSAFARAPEKALSFQDFAALDETIGKRDDLACGRECQQLRLEFRYIVYVGKQIYCWWDEKIADTHRNFDALAAEIEVSITDTTSPTDYYLALRRWASLFNDGHVNALLKADHSNIEIYTAPVRLQTFGAATSDEKVFVSETLDTDVVQVGDQVLAIDGIAISKALDQAELATSGSTKRMRRFFGARRLVDVAGFEAGAKPLVLTLSRAGGAPFEVTLHRNVEVAPEITSPATPATPTGEANIKAMVLPGGLGYLRIDAFSGSQSFFLLDQAMRRLAGTRGLLIDLRRNGGGDQSGNSIIAKLITSPITRYQTSERMNDFIYHARPTTQFLPTAAGSLFADWHNLDVQPSPDRNYLGKPVMALISNNCFSACDTFTAGLKSGALATIVGEGTGGGTGTPLVFDLPVSGHQFRYSVIRGKTADGLAIEGAGTVPEFTLSPSSLDRGKADSQLVQALGMLLERVGAPGDARLASDQVQSSFGSIWKQGFELSPTRSEDARLREISAVDEL